jgi:hypothetical protein
MAYIQWENKQRDAGRRDYRVTGNDEEDMKLGNGKLDTSLPNCDICIHLSCWLIRASKLSIRLVSFRCRARLSSSHDPASAGGSTAYLKEYIQLSSNAVSCTVYMRNRR